jgi:hypothetical protein
MFGPNIKFSCQHQLGRSDNSFRWNLAYADAYVELLWEKNPIYSLKSAAEVVPQN